MGPTNISEFEQFTEAEYAAAQSSERVPGGIMPLKDWPVMVIPFDGKVELKEKRAVVRGRVTSVTVRRKERGDNMAVFFWGRIVLKE